MAGSANRRGASWRTLAKMVRTEGQVAPDAGLSLKPGPPLVREWHGRTHTVTVAEDGFEYGGRTYPSLTKIAKKISSQCPLWVISGPLSADRECLL